MATHLKILSQQDISNFESPPEFNSEERKRFFDLPKWILELIESFKTPTNKIGFVLQLGYFKAVNKFFVARKFHKQDVEFVAIRLSCLFEEIYLEKYSDATFLRHQEIILENLGFQKFNDQVKQLLMDESLFLCTNQIKPRPMFMSLVDFLRRKRIEIPSYNILSEIITDTLNHFEKDLLSVLETHITTQEKNILDGLLEFSEEYLVPEKQDFKLKRYNVTLLKKSNQSTKPSQIKDNIDDLEKLQTLFEQLEPIIKRLGLSSEIIRSYASIIIKSRVFQISRREDNRYLLLIAFVIHQYYTLNDVLIEILIAAAQTIMNTSFREHKELFVPFSRIIQC